MGTTPERRVRRRVLTIVVLAILVSPAIPAEADTSGTLVITADTTLTEDHQGSIVIAADGVTLDCDGHTITGPAEQGQQDSGVFVLSRTDVTVEDCLATGFTQGIEVADSEGVSIIDNQAFANPGNGFFIVRSSRTTLMGNVSTGNGLVYPGAGYTFDESTQSYVADNGATGNDGGVWLHWAHENTFDGNTLDGNGSGLGADGSERNVFVSNSFSHNDGPGIDTIYSHSNTFRTNDVAENGGRGITLESSSDNRLVKNWVYENGEQGIGVGSSYNTTLRANRVVRSGEDGVALWSSNNSLLSKNVLRGNRLGLGLNGSYGNVVADNLFIKNHPYWGVLLVDSSNNRFVDNVATGNKYEGFTLVRSSDNQFYGNVSKTSDYEGFALFEGSNNNVLSDNVATRNASAGFGVFGSSHNAITDNRATLNGSGFSVLDGSSFNDLLRNYACSNVGIDAEDDHTGTDNNWSNNTFCTSNI